MLVTACSLQADPYVDWVSDSYSSFDVILSGTGPGWTGTVTSPSGLWQLSTYNIIQYSAPSSVTPGQVMVDNSGYATFLGQLPPLFPPPNPFNSAVSIGTFGGYNQFFDPAGPINDGNPMNYGYLVGANWWGDSTISVTSTPNLEDVSTWGWTAEYMASGASLVFVTPVPEPTTTSIGVLIVILGFASKLYKDRTRKLLAQRIIGNKTSRFQRPTR